jgi:hypothetical protein
MSDPSGTTSGAQPTATNEGKNSSTPGNSPLLFFVALGFGVVFTNLWYADLVALSRLAVATTNMSLAGSL